MKAITSAVQFLYDFVIGDDWTVAAAVVVALILTFLLSHMTALAWLILPLAIVVFLSVSLRKATKK